MNEREMKHTKIIANPRSANGRTGRNWAAIDAVLQETLAHYDTEFTQAPLDATNIARRALHEGYEMIVCVGGDGTINETVNGFFEEDRRIGEDAVLGILCAGTGGDFVRTIGIPRDIRAAATLLRDGATSPCDVGRLDYVDHDGREQEMHFINIADFGMGGEVVHRVNNASKALKGRIPFMIGMFRASVSYRNQPVTLEADGQLIGDRRVRNVIVANGQYFGGGMRIAKDAAPDDGLFDLIIMGNLGFIEAVRLMPRMYRGEILGHPKVEHMRVKEVRATSPARVLLDVDGEFPGSLPVTLRVMPGAIRLKTPRDFGNTNSAPGASQ